MQNNNTISEQAIKNAKSAMFGFGLTETLIGTKPSTKSRFYGCAVYHRNGFETVIDFSFDMKGHQMSSKVIIDNKYIKS